MGNPTASSELSWLLADLVRRVEQIQQAVLLSQDGLVIATSQDLDRAEAEFLAALSSGISSLANAARDHYRTRPVKQTLVELGDKLFFILPAGDGTCLSVLAANGPKTSVVAFEMALLIKRVRQHFGVAVRSERG
ncbi:roadblock/LC7 domain-containing protein [Actinocorallia longicatena]|uniref:Roadblock/LC7 domain-containing protein n=1 Tax=Actinocorallia longicatena TaxID=111803 RepID=A0ABP6QLN1_9ACTN